MLFPETIFRILGAPKFFITLDYKGTITRTTYESNLLLFSICDISWLVVLPFKTLLTVGLNSRPSIILNIYELITQFKPFYPKGYLFQLTGKLETLTAITSAHWWAALCKIAKRLQHLTGETSSSRWLPMDCPVISLQANLKPRQTIIRIYRWWQLVDRLNI